MEREFPIATHGQSNIYSLDAAARNFVRRAVEALGKKPLPEKTVEKLGKRIAKQFSFLDSRATAEK